jgi:hypothetical protein
MPKSRGEAGSGRAVGRHSLAIQRRFFSRAASIYISQLALLPQRRTLS